MAEPAEVIEVDPQDVPGSAGTKSRGEDIGMLAAASGTPGTQLAAGATLGEKDIAALVNPPTDGLGDVKGITHDLAGITRQEIDARGQILSGMFGRSEHDLARARHALDAEGVGPGELKPWNAAEEARKHEYDPLEAFGSVGSVFATIASAFTRRPMINALNASAAAMEATREAKKEDFTRAYTAWKDNNDLVIKRHNMMHQQYQDAISLMQSDMQLGSAKLSALAAQFGDQKTLALLEHGMSKELFEMLDARARATDRLAEVNDKALDRARKNFDLNERLQADGVTKQDVPRIIREWHRDWENVGRSGGADQEFIDRWRTEHPHGTSAEFTEAFGEFKKSQHQERTLSPDQEFVRRYFEEHPGAKVDDEFIEAFSRYKKGQKYPPGTAGGGNTSLTSERQIAAAVQAKIEQLRADKVPEDEVQRQAAAYRNELRSRSTPLTSTRADQVKGMIDRFEYSNNTIDKIEKMLKERKALTGLGGKLTRPEEVVENWFGSNQTDRAQFRRYISELQEWGPRLLNESLSRPLSAEETRIANIVPGLSPGDTTANTARGLLELQKLFKSMREQLVKRLEGKWTPESLSGGASAAPSPPASTAPAKNWYENYQ